MNDNLGHFINGKITYDEGKKISIFNPSSGKSISSLNCASKPIIDRTIETSLETQTMFNNLIFRLGTLHDTLSGA